VSSYSRLMDRLRSRFTLERMELHFIADDLEDHVWYLDLVADFVDDVQRFATRADEPDVGSSADADYRPASGSDPI
jgi:hypothetical protein